MDPVKIEFLFLIASMAIAYFYSSVGHGGASGYLALMVLLGFEPEVMKATALSLNLVVAGIAFFSYYKEGHFKWKILWPFLITSLPAAYLGAQMTINPTLYKAILGTFLLIAVARILFLKKKNDRPTRDPNPFTAMITGAVLGFFSGMIGIGGGIILTPILLLANYANVREAASASALFIWLNSAVGILGHYHGGASFHPGLKYWVIGVVLTSFLGSYAGSKKWSISGLTYVLAVILFFASAKLFFF